MQSIASPLTQLTQQRQLSANETANDDETERELSTRGQRAVVQVRMEKADNKNNFLWCENHHTNEPVVAVVVAVELVLDRG